MSKYLWRKLNRVVGIVFSLTGGLLVSCTPLCSVPEPQLPTESPFPTSLSISKRNELKKGFSKVLGVGTDVATWFLFHPQNLAHRNADPCYWWGYGFAVEKEFEAGNLVAVSTGADGGFTIRFTNQDLTSRERTYATYSKKFRLQVQQDHLFLDGGYAMNCDEPTETVADGSGQWLEVPSGDYEATVYVIDWSKEPGAVDQEGIATEKALNSYVVVLKPIADLTMIVPPKFIPDLQPDYQSDNLDIAQDSPREPIKSEYPVLLQPKVVYPGLEVDFSLTEQQYRRLTGLTMDQSHSLVVSHSLEPGTIATVVRLSGYSSRTYPFYLCPFTASQNFATSGNSQQFVRIVRTYRRKGLQWTEVKPYDPPSSPTADSALRDRLKQLFASYAATDTSYQNRIKHHRFYAERVASLTKSIDVAWSVANALDLPLATQRELITLSEKELLQRLIRILDEK